MPSCEFFQKMNKWIRFFYYATCVRVFWKKLKSTKRHFEINWPLRHAREARSTFWSCHTPPIMKTNWALQPPSKKTDWPRFRGKFIGGSQKTCRGVGTHTSKGLLGLTFFVNSNLQIFYFLRLWSFWPNFYMQAFY